MLRISLALVAPATRDPYLHHIPKTAGTSARLQLNSLGKWSIRHTECCFKKAPHDRPVISFLRSPTEQTYSQFLECKHDTWGKDVTRNTLFPRSGPDADDFMKWIGHFKKSTHNFNCYHPYNMQTRSFVSTCSDSHKYLPLDSLASEQAVDNMLSLTAIGITRHFRLSICVIMAILTNVLPDECKCNKTFREIHERHHVPLHSISDLNSTILYDVHKITHYDHILYQAALVKFWAQVHLLETTMKISLHCLIHKTPITR